MTPILATDEPRWWWAPNVVGLLSEGICPEHREHLIDSRCPTCDCRWRLITETDGPPDYPYRTMTAFRWMPDGEPWASDAFFASVSTPVGR